MKGVLFFVVMVCFWTSIIRCAQASGPVDAWQFTQADFVKGFQMSANCKLRRQGELPSVDDPVYICVYTVWNMNTDVEYHGTAYDQDEWEEALSVFR